MFKPKKWIGNTGAFSKVDEYRREGKFISIPFGEYGESDSEQKWEIRKKFYPFNFVINDTEKIDEAIEWLNDNIDYGKHPIPVPCDSENDYLIEVLDEFYLHILVADEYHGRGESETYIMLNGIVLDRDEVSDEEIDHALNWCKELFEIEQE